MNNCKVYCYSVYWQETEFQVSMGTWKKKDFATKKEAKKFARKYRKQYHDNPIKPYILRRVKDRDYFKEDAIVEIVPNYVVKNLPLWGEYIIRIWY